MKMHDGQIDIDVALVERLVAGQFPELAALPIRPVRSTGTVNALYRLGQDLCVRLPLLDQWTESLQRELRWLPRLAPHLTLRIPEPIAEGEPDGSYPYPWAIFRWIEGRPYADELIDDEEQAALDLAQFVNELRSVGRDDDAPVGGRPPLKVLDPWTRAAIEAAAHLVDGPAVLAEWERSLAAPPWDGAAVWVHADLLRPNLLVDRGRLRSVIDFGGVGRGDPAADVIAAWSVFGTAGRRAFRSALAVDDGTWARARGFALHQAALVIPYYRATNPGFVALARRTVDGILADR